nr:MAG TPA: hypothetical protein [Caudoviricetes sp.]
MCCVGLGWLRCSNRMVDYLCCGRRFRLSILKE